MKRILAVLLCLLSAYGMMAQERKLQHRPYIDQRRFHYGFLFGVHMQDLGHPIIGGTENQRLCRPGNRRAMVCRCGQLQSGIQCGRIR